MKLKNGYFLEKNADLFVIKPIEKHVELTEIGAFLWNQLSQTELNNNQLLNLLLEKYEISTVLALGEIDAFIKCMKENGILE